MKFRVFGSELQFKIDTFRLKGFEYMKIKAYGKVNISLDVVGKREDGYHLLSMIMQNIDLYDEIEVEKQECCGENQERRARPSW